MASIAKDPGGRKRIQFVDPNGDRKTVRLGKVSKRAAEAVKVKIESLLGAAITGCSLDNETSHWLASLADDLADKLAKVGLIAARTKAPVESLGTFLDAYIGSRARLKPNTKRNYAATRKHLIDYFGEDRLLSGISPGDADEWRESLRSKLSQATVSREVKRARQFFRAALRKKLIDESPFADLASPAQVNAGREYFVTTDVITRVIEACPDAQWRLIVALSRYGGLRCPSEHLALIWGDVDWERNRVTIRSPKTEHHAGGESRVIPLFPELRPYLEAAFDEAEPGTEHVITRYRDRNANLRTQFLRIIARAGEKPWPKLFHNLRASRQTELTAKFPLHVVCDWIGNSAPIADKHYLQVTEGHFDQAVGQCEGGAESGAPSALTAEKAAHFPAQQPAAQSSRGSQETKRAQQNRAIVLSNAMACGSPLGSEVPPRGVEPLSSD